MVSQVGPQYSGSQIAQILAPTGQSCVILEKSDQYQMPQQSQTFRLVQSNHPANQMMLIGSPNIVTLVPANHRSALPIIPSPKKRSRGKMVTVTSASNLGGFVRRRTLASRIAPPARNQREILPKAPFLAESGLLYKIWILKLFFQMTSFISSVRT